MELCEHRFVRCEMGAYLGKDLSVLKRYTKRYCEGDKTECPVYERLCRKEKLEKGVEKVVEGLADVFSVLLVDEIKKFL